MKNNLRLYISALNKYHFPHAAPLHTCAKECEMCIKVWNEEVWLIQWCVCTLQHLKEGYDKFIRM